MQCIIRKMKEVAEKSPDKIILITEDKKYTYNQFINYSKSISAELIKNGFVKGHRVAIVLDKYDEFYGTLFAIWQIGGVAVPLNTTLHDSQLQTLINKADCNFLVIDNNSNRKLSCLTSITLNNMVNSTEFYTMDDILQKDQLAVIMFTSGTTGIPKGVCQTYFSQCENARLTGEGLKLSSNDRVFINTPPYFTSGLSHFLTMISVEGSLVGIKKFYFGKELMDALINFECTGFGGAPAHLIRVVETLVEPYNSTQITFWMSSGDQLPKSSIQKVKKMLPNVNLYNVYGLTEVSGRLCILDPIYSEEKCGSVGKPIGSMTVTIRDENLKEVGSNEVGEVYVEGPLLMNAYLDEIELTNKSLTKYGFKTGDFGYKDDDNYIWLEGRKDDIFKVGGEKVSTNEIRHVLIGLGLFEDVAIIAVDDRFMGRVPVAFVVMKQEIEFRSSQVRKELKKILPSTHIPTRIISVSSIPRTGSGKAIRLELLKIISTDTKGG